MKHWIDIPAPSEEIQSLLCTVQGWLAVETTDEVREVSIRESQSGFRQSLSLMVRPDVEQAFPELKAVGFCSNLSVLDLPEYPDCKIHVQLNNQEIVISLPIKLSGSVRNLRSSLIDRQAQKLNRLAPHLQCPVCRKKEFDQQQGYLQCKYCYTQFGKNNNFNFLTENLIDYAKVKPTDNVSANLYDPIALSIIEEFSDGLILDNGCGLRQSYYDNVVNFEIVNYPTTDVIGVGECLPFQENTFDAVFSLAVLEHVRDPFQCAKEITRVLKPGGKLYVSVPFLQPFHGYPDHFYNMTLSGLKNLFEPELNIQEADVIKAGEPIWALTWFLNSYVRGLPPEIAQQFKELKVSDLLNTAISYMNEPFVQKLSQEAKQELACANYLIAYKPISN